ncbi:MAG: hypothetical protein EB078_04945 [Proteobacteria bacterium]|nr:hypothetical protein [Pseudomonadota bacterium]NDC23603.1 hypothetical protein [Pseudomonadota bacterium]NDD04231.1 hypothetical protein [Pseudomonadota bacterium]NDG27682.1 hypothetical protein [Pseudomonadota bacterium]
MKKFFFALILSFFAGAHQIEMLKIAELNPSEGYAPMLFHQGYLWLGQLDYSSGKNKYSLEVRTPDGERVLKSHSVPHSVQSLYVFDDHRVLMTGKSFTGEGWRTYYSLASFSKNQIHLETHPIPLQYQIEEFAGSPERLFFNEVGDRSIVEINTKGAQLLPLLISAPGKMTLIGDSLFVLERRSFKLGDEDIVKVNLNTHETTRVFNDGRAGIVSILPLNQGELLATTELLGQRVLFIDTRLNRLEEVIPVKGTYPRSLVQWGHCLVVGSEEPLKLTVIDIDHPKSRPVAQFDLSVYASELPNMMSLTVNPETASIFMRSAGLVGNGTEGKHSVYRFNNSSWIPACENR